MLNFLLIIFYMNRLVLFLNFYSSFFFFSSILFFLSAYYDYICFYSIPGYTSACFCSPLAFFAETVSSLYIMSHSC